MEMRIKKECKHSVVYETRAEGSPVDSVYVKKDFLRGKKNAAGGWPAVIDLEVKVLP